MTDLGHCPVTPLLLMLQGKWKAQILYELCIHDTARFGLLKRMLKGITNASLTKALRELESDGLIKREQFNEIPPHVEYSLTEKGNDLQPIFYEIMNGASITAATESHIIFDHPCICLPAGDFLYIMIRSGKASSFQQPLISSHHKFIYFKY